MSDNKFAIIGGDRRQTEIALQLKEKSQDVTIFGLPKNESLKSADSLYESVSTADCIVLPVPLSRDGNTVNTPLTDSVILLQELLLCRPKKVLAGMISPDFAITLENSGIPYYDYFSSETLTVKNAVLTAEAAVAIAVNCTDFSIFGSNALVLGYGRIGRQLAKYLKTLGASVTATSRAESTLATVEADGILPLKTDAVLSSLPKYHYIFNTAPAPIMNREFFENCHKTAFIADLATNSGADLAAAKEFNLNSAVFGGLPGKNSPISAAKFITDEILNYLKH